MWILGPYINLNLMQTYLFDILGKGMPCKKTLIK